MNNLDAKNTTDDETTAAILDPEEYSAMEADAEKVKLKDQDSILSYTHKFREPFPYNGTYYEELTFEWNRLTGRDGMNIEEELERLGTPVMAPEFSTAYQIRMAARCCTEKIGSDAFSYMPLSAVNKIKRQARVFLLLGE